MYIYIYIYIYISVKGSVQMNKSGILIPYEFQGEILKHVLMTKSLILSF